MTNLTNKVILITGAGKGRGRILAKAFAERGAQVAVNDISPINLDTLVEESGGAIKAYVEDVAKKVGVQRVINQVEEDFGRIDVLINHAAVQPNVALLAMDEWDWHRVLDVNLTGAFLMMQSAGRVMQSQGSGVVINLVTDSVRDERNARAELSRSDAAFVASMAGLRALSEQAARELNPFGVKVHTLNESGDTIVEKILAVLEAQ